MRSVTWKSDNGQTIVFGQDGPYYYTALTSTLGATPEVSRAPRQDGQTTFHTALDAPTINLVGSMWVRGSRIKPAESEYDHQRLLLNQAFAPNRWGTLIYHREDQELQIRCRPIATPTISGKAGTFSEVDVDLIADTPYWTTAKEFTASMGFNLKKWHYPWAPRLEAMGTYNRYATVDNPTTELIYPQIEVYTTGQYVTISNVTTQQTIKIEHAIGEGQKLLVDMEDLSSILYTVGPSGEISETEDVSHWLSLDSDPWAIVPGMNQISMTNDVPEDTPRAYVRYRLPFLGV